MAVDILQRSVDANAKRITNLGAPTAATDATRVTTTSSDIKSVSLTSSLGAAFAAAPADHVHRGALPFFRTDTIGKGQSSGGVPNLEFTIDVVTGFFDDIGDGTGGSLAPRLTVITQAENLDIGDNTGTIRVYLGATFLGTNGALGGVPSGGTKIVELACTYAAGSTLDASGQIATVIGSSFTNPGGAQQLTLTIQAPVTLNLTIISAELLIAKT